MPYGALADFLEELDACGQLARVAAEVDPSLEMAEITRRVARQAGPALLFEDPKGLSTAVVTNLLGTEARVCRALEIDALDDITTRIETLIEKHTPQNWFDRLKTGGDQAGANKFRAKRVKIGPAQQVVRLGRDVEVPTLPLVKQWPGETGPAMTGGQLISQDVGSETRAATLCPLQAVDQNRLAVMDAGRSAFARHWANHRAAGEKMPVAVVLGGDPALVVAANIEVPPAVDVYHLTGLLRGRGVDVVACRTHAMEVPAEADMIVEGYLDPAAPEVTAAAGAVRGSHARIERPAPVLHVTAITHRTHPIVPAAIDTGEWGEAGALLKVRERVLLPAIRAAVPSVVDLHLPAFGGVDRFAFVSFHKTYPFEARQVASALWGSAALRFTKTVVLVDADVDVRNVESVLAEMGANVAAERDVFHYDGPLPASDQSGPLALLGRHLGIDATVKIPGEQSGKSGDRLVGSREIEALVTARWSEYKLEVASFEAARS